MRMGDSPPLKCDPPLIVHRRLRTLGNELRTSSCMWPEWELRLWVSSSGKPLELVPLFLSVPFRYIGCAPSDTTNDTTATGTTHTHTHTRTHAQSTRAHTGTLDVQRPAAYTSFTKAWTGGPPYKCKPCHNS